MTIGIIEISNRRTAILCGRAIKKLKERRKETRAAMQRYEGETVLSDDEKITYNDLTLSMILLNALSDQLARYNQLPKTWDVFTLGSEFDKDAVPLLRGNDKGELWVAYFACDKPKAALMHIVGDAAKFVPEEGAVPRYRPAAPERAARPQAQPSYKAASQPQSAQTQKPASASESNLRDLIRMRMPSMQQDVYRPKRT